MEKHITKTLANCKPTEFLKQTNKIRKSVEKWITATDILNLRKQAPVVKNDATPEERQSAVAAQIKSNASEMLDNILEKHPDETLELLALLCFVDPKEVDEYPISEYLSAFASLIADEAVISFFISLVKLGQTNILN